MIKWQIAQLLKRIYFLYFKTRHFFAMTVFMP